MPFANGIYYRDLGAGPPLVILHGGWGYGYYPFDDAIAALPRRFVIPDRSGYGRSPRLTDLPPGFHERAAEETEALLDALDLPPCALWGHSDGAVIAGILAVRAPRRYTHVILEALHLDRQKPRSREFFTRMAHDPDAFGERVVARLAADQGPDWRTIIQADGRAWLHLAAHPERPFFDPAALRVPTLVLSGSEDPRTEPGELDPIRPYARVEVIPGAGHAPHCERASAARVTAAVADFLSVLPSR